nr:DUF4395 domain-containing protein [Pseudonocardia nigra]
MSMPESATRTELAVDPRGVRFAAALTSVVLALVLVTSSGWLLAAQTVVFALGSVAGLRFAPYSVLFRKVVAPRLRPSTKQEEAAPVRFSQTVGLVFAAVGTVGYLTGLTALGIVATAFALAAAFLNAAFGFCLGCELYALAQRIFRARQNHDKQGAVS